MEVIKY